MVVVLASENRTGGIPNEGAPMLTLVCEDSFEKLAISLYVALVLLILARTHEMTALPEVAPFAMADTSQSPAVNEILVTLTPTPVAIDTGEPATTTLSTYSPTYPAAAESFVAVPWIATPVALVTLGPLIPDAKGILAVATVCPSFVIAVDRPVPRSAVSALNAVDEMTVPVTTGWPAVLMLNTPLPLYDMIDSLYLLRLLPAATNYFDS
jgi:hypothetical protein